MCSFTDHLQQSQNRQIEVNAIQRSILAGLDFYKGVALPSPQRTGTGYQQQSYARMEAERIYDNNFKA